MVYTNPVSAHEVLDSFIGREIDGVGGTCTNNDTGHAPPQTHYALPSSHLVGALYHAIVDGRRTWVEDLHSSLDGVGRWMSGKTETMAEGSREWKRRTLIASMGYMTVCSYGGSQMVELERSSRVGGGRERSTDGYACKGAGCHVLQQGEVGRKGFIAAVGGQASAQPSFRVEGGKGTHS